MQQIVLIEYSDPIATLSVWLENPPFKSKNDSIKVCSSFTLTLIERNLQRSNECFELAEARSIGQDVQSVGYQTCHYSLKIHIQSIWVHWSKGSKYSQYYVNMYRSYKHYQSQHSTQSSTKDSRKIWSVCYSQSCFWEKPCLLTCMTYLLIY